jgi:predicted AAA+ superfamily ATPase
MEFQRKKLLEPLLQRIHEPRRSLLVLAGPRQTGKTTLALQAARASGPRVRYAPADEPSLRDRVWLEQQWDLARDLARRGAPADTYRAAGHSGVGEALLILDEVQKIEGWADVVKALWDDDTATGLPLRIVLIESSPEHMQRSLDASLSGRFELIHVPHWSFAEMRDAFGWSVDQYICFGGYPGAAPLIGERQRWARYVAESIVETAVSRDVLLTTRVDKPALLHRLLQLACGHSGRELSYQKMLGRLVDAGNTTTLAHYLGLLSAAGLVAGLQKFTGEQVRQRGSSPKLQVYNPALMTASMTLSTTAPMGIAADAPPAAAQTLEDVRHDPDLWGRLVESAVGAHLLNASGAGGYELFYWRDRNRVVDFVARGQRGMLAIGVKSSQRRLVVPALESFRNANPGMRALLIGGRGMPLEAFLLAEPGRWVDG